MGVEMEVREEDLEIENRMRNLFWTVCGDYSMEIFPDVELFRRSKYIALYEAIKAGAFGRYFQMQQIQDYLIMQTKKGKSLEVLTELTQLCVEVAVYPQLKVERLGITRLREKAFVDYLNQMETEHTLLGRLKQYYMKLWLGRKVEEPSDEIKRLQQIIQLAQQAVDTKQLIEVIDQASSFLLEMKEHAKDGQTSKPMRSMWFDLSEAVWEDCMTDEEMEAVLENYRKKLSKQVLSLNLEQEKKELHPSKEMRDQRKETVYDPEARKKVQSYIEMNYGRSYLSQKEQLRVNHQFCRGLHAQCSLHLTEGILHSADRKNNQYRFSQLQYEKNRMYYYESHWIIKRNIADLADALKKALALRQEQTPQKAKSGKLIPKQLWKVGRTEDQKLFQKRNIIPDSEFVVELLLDSSGSQAKRQPQVAVQGYIISAALSAAGIPHRVTGYCTFWDHTVLQRYRDYEDEKEMDLRVFEFRASGNNRDGLVFQVACDSLLNRQEDNKILIVLSDGKPLDMGVNRPGTGRPAIYTGEEAIRDTAKEIRRARAHGISVLGIFAGEQDELLAEKKIYGKDFVYIRKIDGFARAVGSYLKQQIERE